MTPDQLTQNTKVPTCPYCMWPEVNHPDDREWLQACTRCGKWYRVLASFVYSTVEVSDENNA